MFRIRLFTVAAFMAGLANAQVPADPQAAAPVVYSGPAADASACGSYTRNADGSPVITCTASAQPPQDVVEGGDYAQDYSYDDMPVYDSGFYEPGFYPGVSLIPPDYWAFGLGWPYYGYAAFGFGWPYLGFAGYWGGGFCCAHHGWNERLGHVGGYHGPYRYDGRGHYWGQAGFASASNRGAFRNHATATAFNGSAANRGNVGNFRAAGNTRALGAPVNASRFAPNNAISGRAGQRAVLPSASYYAAAQSGGRATGVSHAASMARGYGVNTRAGNDAYRVTSLPSRNFAASARAGSSYRYSGGSAERYGYSAPRGGYAAAPRAAYSMPQRYSAPSRSYAAQRSAPSYAHSSAGYAPHSSAASSSHSSGGSHASNGDSHTH